jgi:hypothetical protein
MVYFRLPEVSRAESPQFVVTLDGLDPSIFHMHSRKKQQSSSVVMNSPNMDSESSATEFEEKGVNRSKGIQTEKEREKRPASPILYETSSSPDSTGTHHNRILSGYQQCQVVKRQKNQRFENHLCPHPWGTEVAGVPISDIYIYIPA